MAAASVYQFGIGSWEPRSKGEAARILNTKDEAATAAPKTKISVDYEIGDSVKVLDGPFASWAPPITLA